MSHKSELLSLLNGIDADQLKRVIVGAIEMLLPEPAVLPHKKVTAPRARIAAFLFDACDVAAGLECSKANLYQAYQEWCEAKGVPQVTPAIFSKQLFATEPTISMAVKSSRRRYVGCKPKSKRDTLSP